MPECKWRNIFPTLKCKQAPSYGRMASVGVHGEHCAQHQSYLDGQRDVCISTEAASPVAGAVMETSSWGREKSTGSIRASRSAQVWRAPLFSTTITGNLKKKPLLSLLQLMEIATDPLRHNNGVIDTKTGQFNCCENAWSAETQRDGEKEWNSLRSQSRSSRWGVGVPACCLAIPKSIELQLEVKYDLLSKDGQEESD